MTDARLVATPPPHLKRQATVGGAMRDVILALLPVTLVSVYFFRGYALVLIAVCIATAGLTELVFRSLMNKPASLHDGSAILTGLFVALLFPPTTAPWTAALATFLAIGVAKELMGGLGWNRLNPALFGRVAIILLAPALPFLNQSLMPWAIDAVSSATPLALLKQGLAMPPIWELFAAFPGGALAETSPLALLVGGAYLVNRGHINWRIPASMMGTVLVLTTVLGQNPVQHILTGGIILGAFFMATDWVTSPINDRGKIVFGVAIGALTVLFRVGLAPTEGVAFSILIMNAFVPLIERLTKRPSFSEPTGAAKAAG